MKILYIDQGGEGGDQWHEERHGCVTGTKFESAIGACFSAAKQQWFMGGKAWEFVGTKLTCVSDTITDGQLRSCKSKQATLLQAIVSDRQSEIEINDYCSAEMERGNELEPFAIEAISKRHKVNLESCGMLLSDSLPMFKFSPDAIALDKNGVVIGGAETKSKAGKTHIEYMIANVVPSEHLMQSICPMAMDDCVKWWIFAHYDDRNKVNNLFTTGIKRSDYEDFIKVAREVLIEFLNEIDKTVEKMGGAYND